MLFRSNGNAKRTVKEEQNQIGVILAGQQMGSKAHLNLYNRLDFLKGIKIKSGGDTMIYSRYVPGKLTSIDDEICKVQGEIDDNIAEMKRLFNEMWKGLPKDDNLVFQFHTYEYTSRPKAMPDFDPKYKGGQYPGRSPRITYKNNNILFPKHDPNRRFDDDEIIIGNQINFFFSKEGSNYKLHFRIGNGSI